MLTQPQYVMKIGTIDGERIVFYVAGSGSHCYSIACEVAEGEDAGQKTKHTITLINKEGVISEKTIDVLKEVFGCPVPFDPFWLVEAAAKGELDDIRFELTGGIQKGDKGGEYWKGEWLNPLGGGAKMPESNVDRSQFAAKFGSQLRALAGGTPVKSSAPAKAPTKPPPAKSGPPTTPPPSNAPVATMESAWAALCDNNIKLPDDQKSTLWFETMKQMFGTENNSEITPQQWHMLKEKFTDNLAA